MSKVYDSDGYYSDSDSDDEQSEIDKLLILRAEELAIAKSLGFGFQILETSAHMQFNTSQKANIAMSAISNPMQFKTVRDKVERIQKFTRRVRSKVTKATSDVVAAAKDTYEGYKVQDNGKGVRTITKIDQLEKELAELKAMMKMMANNNNNNSNSNDNNNDDNKIYKTPGIEQSQRTTRKFTTIATTSSSNNNDGNNNQKASPTGVHPVAAILKLSKQSNLKKVSGTRSPGGTPFIALKNKHKSKKHSRNASFNESMLSKALHRKFKNTHDTSSDEDESDNNFTSSSESEDEESSDESDSDSSKSSSESEAETEDQGDSSSSDDDEDSENEDNNNEDVNSKKGTRTNTLKIESSPRVFNVRRVSYGVGQIPTPRRNANNTKISRDTVPESVLKSTARVNLLSSIKSFKKNASNKNNNKKSINKKQVKVVVGKEKGLVKKKESDNNISTMPQRKPLNFLSEIKNFKNVQKKKKKKVTVFAKKKIKTLLPPKKKELSLADSILLRRKQMKNKSKKNNENKGLNSNNNNSKTKDAAIHNKGGNLFGVKLRKVSKKNITANNKEAIV